MKPLVATLLCVSLSTVSCRPPPPTPPRVAFPIEVNRTPASTDDYVTWAPTMSRIRYRGKAATGFATVRLTSTGPNGRVRFAKFQSAWPANTTATADHIDLSVPGNGKWVTFAIAGDPAHPSLRDKDTWIDVSVKNSAGVWTTLGRHELMVRVRKNANTLTAEERDRFLEAVRVLHAERNAYQVYQDIHSIASGEAHHVAAFLPWHRIFVLQYERALQAIDPSVSLPYWKYDEAAPNVFSEDFMGANVGALGANDGDVRFSVANPLNGWTIEGLTPINRSGWTNHLGVDPAIKGETATMMPSQWDAFRAMESDPHGESHVWAGGWLQILPWAVRDPLFFMLHANVDRQWAKWQRTYDRFSNTANDYAPLGAFPTDGTQTEHVGSYIDDTMWPWNGAVGNGDPMDLAQRPVVAPGGAFPAPGTFSLGPSSTPRVVEAIDYLGRKDPATGLGFAYDDLPYEAPPEQLRRKWFLDLVSVRKATQADLAVFRDRGAPLERRLTAGRRIGAFDDRAARDAVLAIAADRSADDRLRAVAIDAYPKFDETFATVLVRILEEPDGRNATTKLAALERLKVLVEFSAIGHRMRPAILDAFRAAAKSTNGELRMRALEALAFRDDALAVVQLFEVLGQAQPVNPTKAQAIRLLAIADPARIPERVRASLTSSDSAERVAAIRALQDDRSTRASLETLTRSPDTPFDVQRAAWDAMARRPKPFLALALPRLADAQTPTPLRRTLIDLVAQVANRSALDRDDQAQVLQALAAARKSPDSAVREDAQAVDRMLRARASWRVGQGQAP